MSRRLLTFVVAALVATGGLAAQTFSLDDDPSAPLTGAPAVPPFLSAEDPLGLGSPCVGAGLLGPSPSLLVGPFVDSDMLTLGPVLDTAIPPLFYVGAVSANHRGIDVPAYDALALRFSIDRCTGGIAGTASGAEAAANQQPGDVYQTTQVFRHPSYVAGTLGGCFAGEIHTQGAGGNVLIHNQDVFGLRPNLMPGVVAPPIGRGTHDNLDAFNEFPGVRLDTTGDAVQDVETFFAMLPAEAVMSGTSPADIFRLAPGVPGWGGGGPWAGAPSMCLDTLGGGKDCIDGLVVWNYASQFLDPGDDVALFSLCPSSPTLRWLQSTGWPVDGGTVFVTDFTGSFAIYAYSINLGLTTPFGPEWSNVDALEVRH